MGATGDRVGRCGLLGDLTAKMMAFFSDCRLGLITQFKDKEVQVSGR